MAVKKATNIKNEKSRTCLLCGKKLPEGLKDNTLISCIGCGHKMLIDIYGSTLVITAADHEYLRHRHEQQQFNADPDVLQKLRKELSAAHAEANSWKEAAEGLARQIEEMSR